MNTARILGIMILVVGAVLLAIGFDSSDAPADQIANAFTGRYTDRTMWYIITGVVAIIGGGLLAFLGHRARA